MSNIPLNTSGIYCIMNKLNNKVYIGSSKNVGRRLREHKTLLRTNRHHSSPLQYSWNHYGEAMFVFFVLEVCEEDKLIDREKFWVQEKGSLDRLFGYNIKVPGDFEITKNKSQEKEVYAIHKSTGDMQLYPNMQTLCSNLNLNMRKAQEKAAFWSKKIEGTRSILGYILVYKEDYNSDIDYCSIGYKKRPKKQKVYKEPVINTDNWQKIQLEHSVTGEIIIFDNIKKACRGLNMKRAKIYKCLISEYRRYKHKEYYIKKI